MNLLNRGGLVKISAAGYVDRMSDKEVVIEAVRQLPETVSFEEISERIAILAAICKGEEAADAGRVSPHEDVKRDFAQWISK